MNKFQQQREAEKKVEGKDEEISDLIGVEEDIHNESDTREEVS